MTNKLLEMLEESQQLLNQATDFEDQKRARIRRENLKAELAECSASAVQAYEQASGQLGYLKAIIDQARGGVEALQSTETGSGRRQGEERMYEKLAQAVAEMSEAHQTALEEIEENRERFGTFNITLFGRTMTGKSTLMEILTEGDGHTIGHGAQRATRDTRQYEWNGMKILDVPGVAALGGSDDERVAYQAAQQADLIVFLITDDAPQPVEAEHLAELRRAGNPMLGICNVKCAVNGPLNLRRFLKSQRSLFDPGRLDNIVSQFQEMCTRLGPGQSVEFKHAHLLSRFLADRPEHRDQRVELYTASRFADIEDHIYREVTDNGSFHRQRSFLESTSGASFDIWGQMLIAGTSAWELHGRIQDHVKETSTWRSEFRKDTNARIKALLNSTIGRLRSGIPAFVEANCEDKELAKKWDRRVRVHRHRQAGEGTSAGPAATDCRQGQHPHSGTGPGTPERPGCHNAARPDYRSHRGPQEVVEPGVNRSHVSTGDRHHHIRVHLPAIGHTASNGNGSCGDNRQNHRQFPGGQDQAPAGGHWQDNSGAPQTPGPVAVRHKRAIGTMGTERPDRTPGQHRHCATGNCRHRHGAVRQVLPCPVSVAKPATAQTEPATGGGRAGTRWRGYRRARASGHRPRSGSGHRHQGRQGQRISR